MRIGITLPTFNDDPGMALDAAMQAEQLGIDGVFVFDHLWPMGHPERPSLSAFPFLAAVAAKTERIAVGVLVARIGLLPDAVVRDSLLSVSKISKGRLIAGLGTGDSSSAEENHRLGIAYRSASSRRESLEAVATELSAAGVECWIGAGGRETNEIARRTRSPLNLWQGSVERVEQAVSEGPRVTWAGPLPGDPVDSAKTLKAVASAGAEWSVWAWPRSLETVARAAELAELCAT